MTVKRWSVAPAIALAAALLVAAFGAVGAEAAVKHVDGTVLGTNNAAKTFRIETQGGRKLKFQVNGGTEFERIQGGFAGLDKGLGVEVDFKKTADGRIARQVEPQGSGGGGNGGGGADDPQPHG
jgi:hypothetical protein